MSVVGYGAQIQTLIKACAMAKDSLGISCEIIDLRTIVPWDVDTVAKVRDINLIMLFDSLVQVHSYCHNSKRMTSLSARTT